MLRKSIIGALVALVSAVAIAGASAQLNPTPLLIVCGGQQATIVGDHGANVLHGGPGVDVIQGNGGDDVLLGLGGDDVLCGAAGET